MRIRKGLAILGMVGAVAAVAVVGTAFAQTPTPTPSAGTNYQQVFMDRLAAALGTTTDKLKAALTQARNDTADQAVKDGKLTQQQSDSIKAKPGNVPLGPGFGIGRNRGGSGGSGMMDGGQAFGAVAQALGMTTQDLMTKLKSGQTLAQLAQGKEQAVKDAIVNAEKPRLDQAVKSGRITQDQEKQRLDQIRNSDLSKLGIPWGMHGPRGNGSQKQAPSNTPSRGPAFSGNGTL
jgi:polyhydroxyalkanoate synthesis regulator phasin